MGALLFQIPPPAVNHLIEAIGPTTRLPSIRKTMSPPSSRPYRDPPDAVPPLTVRESRTDSRTVMPAASATAPALFLATVSGTIGATMWASVR
jgi:hypothetical protein